jgi:UDPglucose--hexose-1-phosphate uridylyltransferase
LHGKSTKRSRAGAARNGRQERRLPMPESQMRQDPVTKHWVLYAPARSRRPREYGSRGNDRAPVPAHDAACPFCPGNEERLAGIEMEIPGVGGTWAIRVVPNKYPALTLEGSGIRTPAGLYRVMEGFGCHEVIIETPCHNRQPSRMSVQGVEEIVRAYDHRYSILEALPGIRAVILFRNHGPAAGTSLLHPHSQIIATGIVPRHIRHRDDAARSYFDDWGRCLHCDMAEQELSDGRRVVLANERFVAYVPFAAAVPFEIWIVPRRHRACFGGLTDEERADFAAALHSVLGKLDEACGDPDYNYVIHSSAGCGADEAHLHWHLQLMPRLVTPAGFEMGSGIHINPSIPEEDAALLRGADVPHRGGTRPE